MLIFLNFGQNGVNWYLAPLAIIFVCNTGIVLQLLTFFCNLVAQLFGYQTETPVELESITSRHGSEEDDEETGLGVYTVLTTLLALFLTLVFLAACAYIFFLLLRRAHQVGWRQAFVDLVEYVCLVGMQGGGRPAPPRTHTYSTNAQKNADRTKERMNALPIEVFQSLDELKLLPIRELKEKLRWKRIDIRQLVEKHELLKALIESDSTSNRTCSICCEDYVSGDVLKILPCRHKYHRECIEKWLTMSSQSPRLPTCPYCNASLFKDA